jgi:nucleotide-binding universal stress UspA family protein
MNVRANNRSGHFVKKEPIHPLIEDAPASAEQSVDRRLLPDWQSVYSGADPFCRLGTHDSSYSPYLIHHTYVTGRNEACTRQLREEGHMKVLVATDGSTDAKTAIATTLRLFRREDLSVDVLCVVPELVPAASHLEKSMREGKQVLASTERLLHREGITPGMTLKTGSPAEVIDKTALDCDLVVVGAHGKHERTQPGLGPVASSLIEHSHANVLVGRELTSDKNFRVLVALDGSEASFNALQTMTSVLEPGSFVVTLMHVVELPWAQLDLPAEGAEYEPDASEISDYQRELTHELHRNAYRIMETARDYLEAKDISAEEIIQPGDPALELVSHSEEGGYDLIVVGATGSSDVKHALLGSVSAKLAWDAPCSVLVVRS